MKLSRVAFVIILLVAAVLATIRNERGNQTRISFRYGSADLLDEERRKLLVLAREVSELPQGKIRVLVSVDMVQDAAEYRREELLRQLKEEKFRLLQEQGKVPPTQTALQMEILPAEQGKYLCAVALSKGKSRNSLLAQGHPAGELVMTELARRRAETVRDYLIDFGHVAPERIVTGTRTSSASEGNNTEAAVIKG